MNKHKSEPEATPLVQLVKKKYDEKMAEALTIRDAETGWLSRADCDGMIWAGKYAATGAEGVNIEAAEYDGSGKFGRTPPPRCWTPEAGDQGSKTEWSRDMFTAGLLPYAWYQGRLDILERHAAYGKANNWKMGEPFADGRTVYTPALIGLLFKAIKGLGGDDDPAALWGGIYPSGLVDYEAHLQVMEIWIRGEIAEKLGEGDAVPQTNDVQKAALTVSQSMLDRLQEQAERQPSCPLYQVTSHIYSGGMEKALGTLLGQDQSCDYLRCDDGQCYLADWLFSAFLALRHYNQL